MPSQKNQYKISVGVRIRPTKKFEQPSQLDTESIFSPNHLLPPTTSQSSSYQILTETLLSRLRQNFSTSLIAYGQTGSGKTHTIFGPPGCLKSDESGSTDHGLLPRLLDELLRSGSTLSATAIEVYQDLAYDLLSDSTPLTVGTKGKNQLTGISSSVAVSGPIAGLQGSMKGAHPAGCYCRVCEQARMKKQEEFKKMMAERRGEMYIPDGGDPFKSSKTDRPKNSSNKAKQTPKKAATPNYATVGEKCIPLPTMDAILSLCRAVELSRTTTSHDLNERSSRSHCLVTVHIKTGTTHNTCLLVDLAGSERIEKTNVQGAAKAQAIEINKSLTALGRVVKSLGAGATHVPYRDSTLTMLLRDSFGGNASTTVVVCVAGVASHDEETLRSLQFAQRLGGVRSNLQKSDASSNPSSSRLSRSTIEESLFLLRRQLKSLSPGGPDVNASTPAKVTAFKTKLSKLANLRSELKRAEEHEYEMGGKGNNPTRSGSSSNPVVKELRDRVNHLDEDIERAKYAVDRLSGMRFWKDADKSYAKCEMEIRELEACLVRI